MRLNSNREPLGQVKGKVLLATTEKLLGRACAAGLRYGLLGLLVWTPLAFGAVHTWAYALLEIHVCWLLALWIIRQLMVQRDEGQTAVSMRLLGRPPAVLLLMFFGLLLFQQLPLPTPVLSFLSPATAELYRLFLPAWPEQHTPLSLAPYATKLAFGQLLAYAGMLFLWVDTLRTRRDIQLVAWSIVGTGCAMAIVGIVQYFYRTDAIYGLRDASYATGAFFGPYLNRNHFAGYQTIAIIMGLGLLLTQPVRVVTFVQVGWRRHLFQGLELLSPGRLVLIAALSLMACAMVLAASRGGVLSLLFGLLGFVFLLWWRRIGHRRQAVLVLSLAAMAGIVLWLGMMPLLMRFEPLTESPSAQSLAGRWPAFRAAWHISQDFPLFGIGYEAFPFLSARYQPATPLPSWFFHVHNDYLQLLTETGWIGFALMTGALGLVVWASFAQWRTRRDVFAQMMGAAGLSALSAVGLHALVDFNLHIPANALLVTTVLAMTYACPHLPRPASSDVVSRPADGNINTPRRGVALVSAGLALSAVGWLAFGALKLAAADLIYPHAEVLQPEHWVYRAPPEVARQRLQRAMQWTPSNPWYWRQLANLETPAQHGHEAMTAAAKQQVVDALQRAKSHYEQALRRQPTDLDTQLGWLNVQARLMPLHPVTLSSRAASLETRYTQVASLAPTHPDTQYRLGLSRLVAQANDVAVGPPEPFFRRAMHLHPDYDQKVLQAYLHALPEDEARYRFARVIPMTAAGHQRAANLLERSHWRQARLHYHTAMILSRFEPAVLQTYADALMRQREFTMARDIWGRLLEQTPTQPEGYVGLATALRHLGEHAPLLQTLQQLVAYFPREAAYQAQLADAYQQHEQTREAEAAWKTAIGLQPHDVQYYVGLARLYESQQRFQDAIVMMQRVVDLAPDHAAYQQSLATLYEHSGDRDQAMLIYQRIASQRPDDPQIFYKLGNLAQQQGRFAQAVDYYRRALHLQPHHSGFQQALKQAQQELKFH
jgi:tetratricopeptide (TPR) repeat protein/O-antigen ligase